MRIAVIQMLYSKGHRRLDQEYVSILSEQNNLIIVDDGKHFTDEFCKKYKIDRIKVHPLMTRRCELIKRILHYINLFVVLLILKFKRKDFDAILFLNVHNALYFIYKILPKKKIILFHHQDIDDMISYPKYYKRFVKVKNNFYHICLADFIKEGLCEKTGVAEEMVFTVYQPLVFTPKEINISDKENLLIGIGNSNDEKIVKELIELDKNNKVKFPNHIIMRSSSEEYQGTNLTVISGFLSREAYESLYNRARASIVTYPTKYKLRYSGIIDDSLAKGLIVYANENPCSLYFASKYPTNVQVLKAPSVLWTILQNPLPESSSKDRALFISCHSVKNVREQLNKVLNS